MLYLNSFDNEDSGGNLNLHEYKKKELNFIPSQPKNDECKLIKSISPKSGRLVLFLNSHDAFHSVSEMIGDEKGYFCMVLLRFCKKNPLLKIV